MFFAKSEESQKTINITTPMGHWNRCVTILFLPFVASLAFRLRNNPVSPFRCLACVSSKCRQYSRSTVGIIEEFSKIRLSPRSTVAVQSLL